MDATFTFTVNGQARAVTTDPQRLLVDVLREEFGLTGTKVGCGEGSCGACTVLVDGQRVHSCKTPVSAVDKKTVLTIEGLVIGTGPTAALHPVQEAMIDEQAVQCGYCFNGMIVKASELLSDNPQPTDAQIRTAMNGHLCRCGTYPRVLKAIQRASRMMAGVA